MLDWISGYVEKLVELVRSIPVRELEHWIEKFEHALVEGRQIFVFGNGGSAANAMHFAVDLGKGASDKLGQRFRVICLNDNVSWLTALGNDYAYEEVFVGQLKNFGRPRDLVIALSVSGESTNCVRAVQWAKEHGLETFAMVGGKGGRLAEIADHVIKVPEFHYGRVEDVHMILLHLICYWFMERGAVT